MPFIAAKLAVDGIDSDLLDKARDVYRKEVACWRVIGPAKVAGQERWLASRNSEVALAEAVTETPIPMIDDALDIEACEFSEKPYAMDFVMWRALGKAIAWYNANSKPKLIGITR